MMDIGVLGHYCRKDLDDFIEERWVFVKIYLKIVYSFREISFSRETHH
jgi:hypothetical protein